MSKFHISKQILQGNALFSAKNYTSEKNFIQPPVATAATSFKSDYWSHENNSIKTDAMGLVLQ